MSKFQVGDIVEAFGNRGVVTEIFKNPDRVPVRVTFDVYGEYLFFEHDGKYRYWNKEPSLKLIERPKKKVKKWVNLYEPGVWGGDSRHWTAWDAKFDADSADKASSRKRIACVEIEVEED